MEQTRHPIPQYQPAPPALPGATASPAGRAHARRPRPGRVRRAVSYVLASMRIQPMLTISVVALCAAIGVTHLWATQPYWLLRAQYRIGSLDNDPAASPLRVEVAPGELRDLLTSAPVVRSVAQALESLPAGEAAEAPVSRARQAGIDAWTALRRLPGRIAATLGAPQGEAATSPDLIVSAPAPGAGDRVVELEIRAATPVAAEQAPALLLDQVRNLLLHQERSRTLARVEELGPLREDAATKMREAAAAVSQYRLEIGRHDPEVSAQEIQTRLIRTQGDRADLETDLREAEANRIDIGQKLKDTAVEQTTRVVVEQNKRVQDLRNEISGLEARYAAERAIKTDKHPDMVRLRLEIESKKRDLNSEELLVIREKVQEPSIEYVGLLERQAQNNRELVTLAGRELGLAETEEQLQAQLVAAMKTADHMNGLVRARDAAESLLRGIDQELAQLQSRLTSVVPFSQITLVGQPTVADRLRPDLPNAPMHLLVTSLVALLAAMLIPTLVSLIRARTIATWQVEQLSDALPIQLVGELPGAAQRVLARLPGGQRR